MTAKTLVLRAPDRREACTWMCRLLLAMVLMASAGAVAAPSAFYQGGTVDLFAPPGSTLAFNTDSGQLLLGAGAYLSNGAISATATDIDGAAVWRFRNVKIDGGVNVSIQGTRPIVLSASADMYVSSSFDASANRPGRIGGGRGGDGANGGGGGPGGNTNGTGGPGGNYGTGGDGGNSFIEEGQRGNPGSQGTGGQQGQAGSPGSIGGTGSFGAYGFNNGAGGPAGGAGGGAGSFLGGGGDGSGPGGGGSPGGGGGGASATDGGNGGEGVAGGTPNAGSPGQSGSGGSGGFPGGDGLLNQSAATLSLFAGTGGGGGGGGGGGKGGGQGGGGGGGGGGSGGGGGGVGALGNLFGIGDGGNGGRGGSGTQGGRGGNGGTGGTGGTGGRGGDGGGGIILSARGLLQVDNAMTVNISATQPGSGVGGAPGQGGFSGANGAFPGTENIAAGGGGGECVPVIDWCGGDGGKGGNGGIGGAGGLGGNGGAGGQGGRGGYGSPGMLKLHGSVINAASMTVQATNINPAPTPGNENASNGKLTLISNMNATALGLGDPGTLTPATIVRGETQNPDIQGPSTFTAGSIYIDHPFLPNLQTGPAIEGILRTNDPSGLPDFYNRAIVDAAPIEETLPPGNPLISVKLKILRQSTGESPFDGYDQVYAINLSGENFTALYLEVDPDAGGPIAPFQPRPINGGTGELDNLEYWTTTVPAGSSVRLLQTPIITQQPEDRDVFPNTIVQYSVTAESATPMTYQWETDKQGPWLPLAGETNPTLTVNSGAYDALDPEWNYRVRITNDAGEVISQEARLLIFGPPEITSQPQSITRFPTQSALFSVGATGFGRTYQWQKLITGVWTNIPSANLSSFSIPIVATSDAGSYRVIVSNLTGSVTSSTAILTVPGSPLITDQPDNTVVPPGQTANFSITAIGSNLVYRWQYLNNPLNTPPDGSSVWTDVNVLTNPSAATANLSIPNVSQVAHEGWYRCRVINPSGNVNSDPATLTVGDPGITQQPLDLQVDPFDIATFTVTAVGTGPFSYQWFKDGLPVGPNSATFNVRPTGVVENDQGMYWVVISGLLGTVESRHAQLLVNDPPAIITQPVGLVVDPGASFTLSVTAQSEFPMNFVWQKDNGTIIPNARISGISASTPDGTHTVNLQISGALLTDEGSYKVVISNTAGSATSTSVTVYVGALIECVATEGAGDIYAGTAVHRLSVTTTGGKGTRTYQFKRDGVAVGSPVTSNADPFTAPYEIVNVAAANAGIYTVDITDDRGTIECAIGQVRVFDHLCVPVLTNDSPLVLTEGDSFTLTADVCGGIPPITYTWLREDSETKAVETVAVTTDDPNLTINNTVPADSGDYYVQASDNGSDVEVSNTIVVIVEKAVPVASGFGLAAIAGLTALLGGATLRRRKK